jgi:hypothetical protein
MREEEQEASFRLAVPALVLMICCLLRRTMQEKMDASYLEVGRLKECSARYLEAAEALSLGL